MGSVPVFLRESITRSHSAPPPPPPDSHEEVVCTLINVSQGEDNVFKFFRFSIFPEVHCGSACDIRGTYIMCATLYVGNTRNFHPMQVCQTPGRFVSPWIVYEIKEMYIMITYVVSLLIYLFSMGIIVACNGGDIDIYR